MTVDQVGLLAVVITVIYTGVGLPFQIRKNYQRQSADGLSLFLSVVLFFTCVIWVIYGYLRSDWYIVVSNVPGAICMAIILGQFYCYRKSKTP